MNPRPIYSDTAAKSHEHRVSAYLSELWGVGFWPLPRFCPVDWMLEKDGSIDYVAELKARSIPHDRYDTLILSVHKWAAMREFAAGLHVDALLLARFTDGHLLWANLDDITIVSTRIGGATNSADPYETEPVVHLQIADMLHACRQCGAHMPSAMRRGDAVENANGRTDGRTDGEGLTSRN